MPARRNSSETSSQALCRTTSPRTAKIQLVAASFFNWRRPWSWVSSDRLNAVEEMALLSLDVSTASGGPRQVRECLFISPLLSIIRCCLASSSMNENGSCLLSSFFPSLEPDALSPGRGRPAGQAWLWQPGMYWSRLRPVCETKFGLGLLETKVGLGTKVWSVETKLRWSDIPLVATCRASRSGGVTAPQL